MLAFTPTFQNIERLRDKKRKLTEPHFILRSSKSDGFARRVTTGHFNENSSFAQNLVDAVAFRSNHVLMLGFLNLHADGSAFAFLKNEIF